MHILHIYKDYFPVVGGIENHIRMLAEAQVAAGHQVTVSVCAPGLRSYTEEYNGVQVVRSGRLGTTASMPLSFLQPLALARMRPDIAHIHTPYPLGALANWLWGRARATVITFHSDIIRQKRSLYVYGPILRRILQGADMIIATSEPYLKTSPWLQPVQDHCMVVPLGIDLAHLPVPCLTRARRPQTLPPTLLFVGRLRYYKGLDTLLHALPAISQARLLVVGDGSMRGPWQQLALELGLGSRVEFTGEVSEADLLAYYATADLFVLPANARSEAFGTVLLEAMAAGLPVVSTEVGTGTSWVNQDGVTGRVVAAGNPALLAAAMQELLMDAPRRQRLGKAARRRVETEFSLAAMVRGVEVVYEQALRRKHSTRVEHPA